MNEDNKENEVIDPRTIEAEVIGELRKESIGKPKLVIIIMLIIIVTLAMLPVVNKMLNDENSALYKFIYGNTINPVTPNGEEINEIVDATKLQLLSNEITMQYENLIIKNMGIVNGKLEAVLYSYNGIVNLDKENLFLEVYTGDENKLGYYKLSGNYDYQEKKVVFINNGLSYNLSKSYYVKVIRMNDEDYPEYTVNSDESQIGSVTCKLDNRTIEYVFLNGSLISIKDNVKVNKSSLSDEEYTKLLKEYTDLANNYNNTNIANTLEIDDGFEYNVNLELNPDTSLIDGNYYNKDTLAKKVVYTEIGKGFDCK